MLDEELIRSKCRVPKIGDTPQLGDVVALGIEPNEPYGRIVGFLKQTNRFPVVVRKFERGDGWFPTGECRQGAIGVAWAVWE